MKILQINAVNGIRSTGRICTEMADYLNENGHEGYIAYSSGPSYKKGFQIGTRFEKKLHALFSRIFGAQAYFSKTGTRKLLQYMEQLKPDVVHLHNLHGNYINLKLLLTYLAEKDIPTVLALHDCWFYTGRCFHYTEINCKQWQKVCIQCPKNVSSNPSWFFDKCNKMFNDKKKWFGQIARLAVVGVSDWITNEVKQSLLSSAKIIKRIYNWIDLDVFKPVGTSDLRKKMGLENKFVILGVSSGWSNAKGLDKYFELANNIPDNMRIVLVGSIKDSANMPESIIHIKETHNVEEMVGYYSMADVLLNLSREESFGKVTAEALACGTPVIVLNSTANPELVGEGCGYVLENLGIGKILDVIKEVKKHGKDHYSEKCSSFAQENFEMVKRIDDHISLYHEISRSD